MIVSLNLIREHGHFEESDVSDTLLTQYYDSAVENAETYIHQKIVSADPDVPGVAEDESSVPAEIKQFLLVTICDYCEKRERISDKSLSTYFNHLLDKYILY